MLENSPIYFSCEVLQCFTICFPLKYYLCTRNVVCMIPSRKVNINLQALPFTLGVNMGRGQWYSYEYLLSLWGRVYETITFAVRTQHAFTPVIFQQNHIFYTWVIILSTKCAFARFELWWIDQLHAFLGINLEAFKLFIPSWWVWQNKTHTPLRNF